MGQLDKMGFKTAWVVDSSQYFSRLESECIAKACKNCRVESMDIKEALKRFKRGVLPDVLVVDIQQPKINGVKLVNILKDRHPEMNIVVCSAEARKYSHDLVGMTLISKPISSLPLYMETMREVIGV